MLIHGMWMASWIWDDMIAGLEQRGHRVTALDLPGHGDHPTPLHRDLRVADHVDFVAEQCRDVGGDRPLVLVGHSMGAAVAMHAAERVGAAGLVLVNPGPPRGVRIINRWSLPLMLTAIGPAAFRRSPAPLSEKQAHRMMLHASPPPTAERIGAKLGSESPNTVRDVVWVLSPFRSAPDPRPLPTPTVVVAGTEDHIAPSAQILPAMSDWAGGAVDTVELNGVGHLAPVEVPSRMVGIIDGIATAACNSAAAT